MPPRNQQNKETEEVYDEMKETPYYDPEVGEILYGWEFSEYEKGHRGKTWYFVMSLIGVILLFYSVWTENFTFALLILLFALVYFLMEWRHPGSVVFVITDIGIGIGRKFYNYSDLEAFWVIYHPPEIKNLYFRFPDARGPRFSIPLEGVDPVEVRELLLAFMDEDLEQEIIPLSESFGKIFRL
jgi:hypothetical protein